MLEVQLEWRIYISFSTLTVTLSLWEPASVKYTAGLFHVVSGGPLQKQQHCETLGARCGVLLCVAIYCRLKQSTQVLTLERVVSDMEVYTLAIPSMLHTHTCTQTNTDIQKLECFCSQHLQHFS